MVSAATRGGSRAGLLSATLALCILISILEGFDLQAAGVAAPRLAPALKLASGQLGLFFSASTLGLLVGAALGGRVSDRVGRRRTLLASVAAFGLMSAATGLAWNFESLMVARLLTGLGLGGALPNLIALAAESAPPARRGGAVALLYAGLPAGGAIASLATLVDADPAGWRSIFLVGGVLPLVVLPMLAVWLPDGRRTGPAALGTVRDALFGQGRAPASLLLWAGFFLGLLVFYLLLNWLPSLVVSRGLTRGDASWVQFAFNVGGASGSAATGALMDRWGRAPATGSAFAAGAASLALLALVPADFALLLLAGAAVGAAVSGSQASLYALAPTPYPTEVRGTGVGAAVSAGRLGSVLGPLLAGSLLGSGQSGAQVVLILIPILAASGAAATALALLLRPARGV